MSVVKRRAAHAAALARRAWIAVALTPAGWVLGIVLAFLSGEGGAKGTGPVTVGLLGVLLFVAAPATAVVLAVRAARAGHRSGRIAEMVSGSLLVATLFLTLLLGWIGLVVTAVVAVLVLVGVHSRNKPSPPGPDGVRRPGNRLRVLRRQAHLDRPCEFLPARHGLRHAHRQAGMPHLEEVACHERFSKAP